MTVVKEYKDLLAIREDIDAIDKKIISLIADRIQVTNAAYKFKKSEEDVRAIHRQEEVLEGVKKISDEHNIDNDIVVEIYKNLIGYCVENQIKTWKKNKGALANVK